MKNKEQKLHNNQTEDLEALKKYVDELVNFLPVAFCVANPLDYVLEVNNFFEVLSHYEKIEVIGMDIQDLFLEKEEIKSLIKEVKQNPKRLEKELTLITKEEKTVPVNISVLARQSDDEFIGFFLTIMDVTEKRKIKSKLEKELEQKTTELEKKAQQMEDSRSALLNILEDVDKSYKEAEKERSKTVAIIENIIDGMLFFGGDNHLSIINPQAENFFDIKAEDVTGCNLEELTAFPTLQPLVEFIKDGNKIADLFREELVISENFYLEVTTTGITEDGVDIGTLVHIHDITREKRIEKIKSEFVSVAAHQLRTPLSGIKWTLETFLEEAAEEQGKLSEDEETLIRKAYHANERMVHLVNDLLNVSRIEEGRYIYEPEVVDILELLNPIIEEYKETIKQKEGLSFQFNKLKDSFPKVKIDTEKIGIVVQNFLDNAIKYTDEGEIVLSVDIIDNKLKIAVQDEGVGIPEEQKERLFNKFFRAENVMRKDVEGSGLGLFIAKNIVEAHNGEIGFQSTEEEGSTFYFTLPLYEREEKDF